MQVSIFILLTTATLSCSTISGSKAVRYENNYNINQPKYDEVKNLVTSIHSTFIKPLDIRLLTKAALKGMSDINLPVKVDISNYAGDSLTDLRDAFYYLCDNNPQHIMEIQVGAIQGIVNFFYPQIKLLNTNSNPLITAGIGVVIQMMRDEFIVSSILKDSPAQKYGLLRGDRLLKIDNRDLQGFKLETVVDLLQGVVDSPVNLTIERDGIQKQVLITRVVLNYPAVEASLKPNGNGYVRIAKFDSSTKTLLEQQLSELTHSNNGPLNGLIIDIRDNGGGELRSVINVADQFLDNGLIVEIRGRLSTQTMRFMASINNSDVPANLKLVVLVNGQTGEGAEIFAAALRDQHRATLIGTTTQGLNMISTVLPYIDGVAVNLVTAVAIRSNGNTLSHFGIVPDICINDTKPIMLNTQQYQTPDEIWNACPSETKLFSMTNDVVWQTAIQKLLEK
ncbi:S41 family peptidase [Methylomonas sp. AM2-LC]|uniref:S41 family peptidase n=1 Tax=Methylomonas sp. AM2-LC TaxID=3153301 RepID=UPI0032659467